jgi:hypothetical protein
MITSEPTKIEPESKPDKSSLTGLFIILLTIAFVILVLMGTAFVYGEFEISLEDYATWQDNQ